MTGQLTPSKRRALGNTATSGPCEHRSTNKPEVFFCLVKNTSLKLIFMVHCVTLKSIPYLRPYTWDKPNIFTARCFKGLAPLFSQALKNNVCCCIHRERQPVITPCEKKIDTFFVCTHNLYMRLLVFKICEMNLLMWDFNVWNYDVFKLRGKKKKHWWVVSQ